MILFGLNIFNILLYKMCNLGDILFHEQPPLHIHHSLINSNFLIVFRVFAAIYLTAFYIYDLTSCHTLMYKIKFLTDNGYFLTWLYFITVNQSYFFKKIKGLDKYVQIIFQIVFCLQVLITSAYWLVLYKNDSKTPIFKDIHWHAVPLLFLLIDFVQNCYRFIPKQYLAVLATGLIYLLGINMPYSLTVRPVYGTTMDWVGWFTYVFVAASLIIIAFVFFISSLIFKKFKQPKIRENNELTNLKRLQTLQNQKQDQKIEKKFYGEFY